MEDKDKNNTKIYPEGISALAKEMATILSNCSVLMDDVAENIYKNIIPPLRGLISALEINKRNINVLDILIDNNIVFWNEIDDNFAEKVLSNSEPVLYEIMELKSELCIDYFKSNTIVNELVLQQSITSYKENNYGVCVTGLFSIIDGILSNMYDEKTELKVPKRVKAVATIANKYNIDQPTSVVYAIYTLVPISKRIYSRVEFNEKEPAFLNRHWTMHGRAKRKFSKNDCLLLFRIIKALIIINDYITDIEN